MPASAPNIEVSDHHRHRPSLRGGLPPPGESNQPEDLRSLPWRSVFQPWASRRFGFPACLPDGPPSGHCPASHADPADLPRGSHFPPGPRIPSLASKAKETGAGSASPGTQDPGVAEAERDDSNRAWTRVEIFVCFSGSPAGGTAISPLRGRRGSRQIQKQSSWHATERRRTCYRTASPAVGHR